MIDASNWFSEHEPTEKMKVPFEKLYKVYRRKERGTRPVDGSD